MKAALIMLKNSRKQILEIAYSCGYPTLSSFNRTFKSTFGIPPSKWRKFNREVKK
jgi:AraC-like DNA-binding protein